jgi:heptosyltransferase-2
VKSWIELGRQLAAEKDVTLLLVEGEADGHSALALAEAWHELPMLRARLLPLPILAALLRRCALFLGHDSGVTHLAAASSRELPVVALFGASDPAVWAPPRAGVTVIRNPAGLGLISVEEVAAAARPLLR